ncbi:hypothetical protein ACFLS9_08230, partial [Bacteroidota bacterium]
EHSPVEFSNTLWSTILFLNKWKEIQMGESKGRIKEYLVGGIFVIIGAFLGLIFSFILNIGALPILIGLVIGFNIWAIYIHINIKKNKAEEKKSN